MEGLWARTKFHCPSTPCSIIKFSGQNIRNSQDLEMGYISKFVISVIIQLWTYVLTWPPDLLKSRKNPSQTGLSFGHHFSVTENPP